MNTFNKKSLCVALAATGMLGAAGVAQAVNVSENGLGNVLIYPYYTVNTDINGNAFNTLMSVVNTTASTKAIKVRFREGRNSAEVLDFNVFLSPFDVWTASITPGDVITGSTEWGAKIATADNSCTIPTFNGAENFRTSKFASEDDNAVSRTSEGYFEVFEMATYDDNSVVAVNSKHSDGVPEDCSKVTNTSAAVSPRSPQGGLFGGVTILSPAGGGAFSQPATALANFTDIGEYFNTGSESPNYGNAIPISNVIAGASLYRTEWEDGFDAVTAVLMANALTNEYVLDVGSKSQTTFVATFPTKYNYVNSLLPIPPFTSRYVDGEGACENFYGVVFDREEGSPQIISEDDFSPTPTPGAGPQLCWEAQNISFGSSNVFGSRNNASISTTDPGSGESFSNGWSVLAFNNVLLDTNGDPIPPGFEDEHTMTSNLFTDIIDLTSTGGGGITSGASVTYYGLPVVGFAAQTFQNDAVVVNGQTYLSTFGVTFPHHFSRLIYNFVP